VAVNGTDIFTGTSRLEAGHVPVIFSGGSCTVRGQLNVAGGEFIPSVNVMPNE
jgi:hypothetical protein